MSITAYSAKRNRVYARKFDHDEARRRHAAGEAASALAAEYGVTYMAVWNVVTPGQQAKNVAYSQRWRTTTCEVCGGPAMKNVGGKKQRNPDGRVLCRRCRGDEQTERLRFNNAGRLVAVRCTSLDCANGERWQRPENFPKGTRHKHVRPGGIHQQCRACNTRMKRELRERTRVPCSHGCGTMVDGINRRQPDKPPECRSCSRKRVLAEQRQVAA